MNAPRLTPDQLNEIRSGLRRAIAALQTVVDRMDDGFEPTQADFHKMAHVATGLTIDVEDFAPDGRETFDQ